MCKRRVERAIPQDVRDNNNVNVGLLNMSSEQSGDEIIVESVIQYVIGIICVVMVLKWIRKCWSRRHQRRLNPAGQQMAMNQIQAAQHLAVQAPPAPLAAAAPAPAPQPPAPVLALPAPAPAPQHIPVPIIVHHNQYQPADRVEDLDRMEKYRT